MSQLQLLQMQPRKLSASVEDNDIISIFLFAMS